MIPPCNACGGSLTKSEPSEGLLGPFVHFGCGACDQSICLYPDGRSHQTILPRLYPAPRTAKDHHEQVDHDHSQAVFFSLLMVEAGYRPRVEHLLMLDRYSTMVDEYKAEHPLPQRRWRLRRRRVNA